MKLTKRVSGHLVELDYRFVKQYKNRYMLYEVYKDNKFLYRTCLDIIQLKKLINNKYMIDFEVVG